MGAVGRGKRQVKRRVALIGGTGATALVPAGADVRPARPGRWGAPSGALRVWQQGDIEICFLPRHGDPASIAPHRVNYRANIDLLRSVEPQITIALNAVGGIVPAASPGRLVIPDQLIDYTWGRAHSFFDEDVGPVRHVEFDPPFDESSRRLLVEAARAAGLEALESGTYGVTQGPRLETAAEIDRLAADGCDIVGMTAMPEAGLAREAGLRYAVCATVVNRAAGRLPPGDAIHADIEQFLAQGLANVRQALTALLARF